MVYISNIDSKIKQKIAIEEYEKEEIERKRKNQEAFFEWSKNNPNKSILDYILYG